MNTPKRLVAADLALLAAYLVSGALGLIYQVLWARALALRFGSDVLATSIVLAVFMGGLALGGWIGSAVADRVRRPVLLYGLLELAIGGLGLAIGPLLASADPLLETAYRSWFATAPLSYELARTGVALAALLPPTTLMGMTLPLVVRHVVSSKDTLGTLGARFYAVNTFGAIAGALVSGFALIPALGIARTTLVTAGANAFIGVVCVLLGFGGTETASLSVSREGRTSGGKRLLVVAGVSGFAALALEVLWTRCLMLSFGATVYSFAIMLVCFLFGIALGSTLVGRVLDRAPDPVRLLAWLELAVGVSVAAVLLSLECVPSIYGGVLASLARSGQRSFAATLVGAPLAVSFLLLAIPTCLLGATFPTAVRAYGDAVGRVGAAVGHVSAANTLGAVLGAVCAGFLLVPLLGTKASLALVALLFVANGALAGKGRVPWTGTLLAAGLVALLAGVDLAIPYRPILNYNQRSDAALEVVHHAEGPSATVDLVRSPSSPSSEDKGRPITSLVIGGNTEADDSWTQMRHFVLKAHLPLLYLDSPKVSVLVVGLGMGLTLHSSLGHPGVERIQVVELSREILECHGSLAEITHAAVRDPRVSVRIDDGRNYLKFADATYDMITADPIHPKVTGVGYLYTSEYYRSIKEHLRPGGVVCQWMPLYQLSPRSIRVAFKSFLEVFPQGTFWYVKNHGLFVARNGPATLEWGLLEKKLAHENVQRDLASIGAGRPEELLSLLLLGPEEARAYVDADPEAPLNTDDFPYLEYQAPRELFHRPRENVADLVRFARPRPDLVQGIPPDVAERVTKLWNERKSQLVDEPR